jgi:tyrosyl-tRNA synthetase
MELAARIVADFHSAADAAQAREDFNREVRQGAMPADVGEAPNPAYDAALGTHVPKMLYGTGLASSRTEAERLLKSGAVELDGQRWTETYYPHAHFTVRSGKKWKKITV